MLHFFDQWYFPLDQLEPDQRDWVAKYLRVILVGGVALLLAGQIALALRGGGRWRRWSMLAGVAVFDAAALVLLDVMLSALFIFPPHAECQTSAPTSFTAPGGKARLVVYSFDCGEMDRLFIVSMLKPGEVLPYYHTADMLYEGKGSPRLVGDDVNVKVAWANANVVTVSIEGLAENDIGQRRAFSDEDVYVDLRPLK